MAEQRNEAKSLAHTREDQARARAERADAVLASGYERFRSKPRMLDKGWQVYPVIGETVGGLVSHGDVKAAQHHRETRRLLGHVSPKGSRRSEAAFHPDMFPLKASSAKSLKEQLALIKAAQGQVFLQSPGSALILPDVATLLELFSAHEAHTGESLAQRLKGKQLRVMDASDVDGEFLGVSGDSDGLGIKLRSLHPDIARRGIVILPILVPDPLSEEKKRMEQLIEQLR